MQTFRDDYQVVVGQTYRDDDSTATIHEVQLIEKVRFIF